MVSSTRLDRGITILEGSSSGSLQYVKTGVVIIASQGGGTSQDGELYKISNTAQAKQILGDPTQETAISHYVEIVQRYGIGSILAGFAADVTTILNKLSSAYSDFGINPDIIVIPELGDGAFLESALEMAEKMGSVIIGDFAKDKDVDTIVTERGGDGGLGIKNKRFVPCFGYTKSQFNQDWVEPLSLHIAGQMAMMDSMYHAGRVASNQPLKGVTEIAPKPTGGATTDEEPLISVSFVSQESGSEKLNDVGVVTLNRRKHNDTDTIVSWGDRNGLYPKEQTYDSLIAVVRIGDLVLKMAKERAQYFIDMPSNRHTGETLESSIKSGLAQLAGIGAIASDTYSAMFIESESDYSTGRFVVCLEFSPITNLRLIELKPVYKFTITTTRV